MLQPTVALQLFTRSSLPISVPSYDVFSLHFSLALLCLPYVHQGNVFTVCSESHITSFLKRDTLFHTTSSYLTDNLTWLQFLSPIRLISIPFILSLSSVLATHNLSNPVLDLVVLCEVLCDLLHDGTGENSIAIRTALIGNIHIHSIIQYVPQFSAYTSYSLFKMDLSGLTPNTATAVDTRATRCNP